MEIMLKCFLKVMFQTSKLGKPMHVFFFQELLVNTTEICQSLKYLCCIRMMDIVGRSKSIAIVLPLRFFFLFKQVKGDSVSHSCASLFHMSHLKRDLDIEYLITTMAKMCSSTKVDR